MNNVRESDTLLTLPAPSTATLPLEAIRKPNNMTFHPVASRLARRFAMRKKTSPRMVKA